MDRQIVDPNPGLNYDAVTRTSKWKKNMYIAAVQLQIVMLNDTVHLLKNLGHVW